MTSSASESAAIYGLDISSRTNAHTLLQASKVPLEFTKTKPLSNIAKGDINANIIKTPPPHGQAIVNAKLRRRNSTRRPSISPQRRILEIILNFVYFFSLSYFALPEIIRLVEVYTSGSPSGQLDHRTSGYSGNAKSIVGDSIGVTYDHDSRELDVAGLLGFMDSLPQSTAEKFARYIVTTDVGQSQNQKQAVQSSLTSLPARLPTAPSAITLPSIPLKRTPPPNSNIQGNQPPREQRPTATFKFFHPTTPPPSPSSVVLLRRPLTIIHSYPFPTGYSVSRPRGIITFESIPPRDVADLPAIPITKGYALSESMSISGAYEKKAKGAGPGMVDVKEEAFWSLIGYALVVYVMGFVGLIWARRLIRDFNVRVWAEEKPKEQEEEEEKKQEERTRVRPESGEIQGYVVDDDDDGGAGAVIIHDDNSLVSAHSESPPLELALVKRIVEPTPAGITVKRGRASAVQEPQRGLNRRIKKSIIESGMKVGHPQGDSGSKVLDETLGALQKLL